MRRRCGAASATTPAEDDSGRASPGGSSRASATPGARPPALASFAAAVAGYFGTPDLNSDMWSTDPEFLPWVRALVREVPLDDLTAGTPARHDGRSAPSAVNVAATSDAEIAAARCTRGRTEPSYPEPSMWLQAVLATPTGRTSRTTWRRRRGRRCSAAGWDPAAAADAAAAVGDHDARPAALWEEIQ